MSPLGLARHPDPYDVEDPDQLRILVQVEAQDAAARPELS